MGKANRARKQKNTPTTPKPVADTNVITKQKKASKKERLKLKRESFINKLTDAKKIADQQGFSFHQLLETLNDPNHVKLPTVDPTSKKRPRLPPSTRQRNKILVNNKKTFGLVLDHPQYRSNPLATIREHVQNSLKSELAKQEKVNDQKQTQSNTTNPTPMVTTGGETTKEKKKQTKNK